MILSYDKFRQTFDDYCKKAEAHDAPWIPKDSWRAIKDFLNQGCARKEDVSITFEASSAKDGITTWNTSIANAFCVPNMIISIPDTLKREFEAAYVSNKIGTYPSFSSYCGTYSESLGSPSPQDLVCNFDYINRNSWTIKDGSLVLNPNDGSVSICTDGHFNTITSGASYTSTYQDKEKENDTMNIPTMKFDFGPANPEAIAMSPYGLAVRCGDSWYAFNANEGQTIDVTGMTFSFKNAIYKMPVAVNQVKEGDLIIHQKKAMYVVQVNDKTSIEVIDLAASEQKTVIPVSNMFGFNYVTKVAPLFNLGNVTPSAENPFGNILPMMMMSSMFEDDKNNKSEGNDFMQMMLMMSLMNGTNPFNAMFAGAGPQAE